MGTHMPKKRENLSLERSTISDPNLAGMLEAIRMLHVVSGMDRHICPEGHFGITRLLQMMLYLDLRDRLFNPRLTLLIDFPCSPLSLANASITSAILKQCFLRCVLCT